MICQQKKSSSEKPYKRLLAKILIWLFLLCISGLTNNAFALTEKNITGACRTDFYKWKKRGGYGAFAMATNGYCGYSWDNESLAIARTGALSSCRAGGKGKRCEVVSEISTPSKIAVFNRDCAKSTGQAKIDACTWLINSKRYKGKDQAWNYNERGRAYDSMGSIDLAIADYTNAIKSDGSYGWAYSNRAKLRYDRGDYEAALADLKFGLKKYKSGGDDYRNQDQATMATIQKVLSSIYGFSDDKLCNLALASSKKDWDQSTKYSSYVREAKRRGLDVDRCRILVPLPPTAQVSSTGTSSLGNMQNLSNKPLCEGALSSNKTAWETRAAWTGYVAESQRRGFSINHCRVILRLPPQMNLVASPVMAKLPESSTAISVLIRKAPVDQLCGLALTKDKISWDVNTQWGVYVEEAKRRGLSIDRCRLTLRLPILPAGPNLMASVLQNAPIEYICRIALNSRKTNWDPGYGISKEYSETQRRGLSIGDCRVALGLPRQLEVVTSLVQPESSGSDVPAAKFDETRIALVIGNSTYRHVSRLENPDSDAELMTTTLQKAGFKVTKLIDADQSAMKKAMLEFGRELRGGADASLFYYSGHGVQVKAENYLIPVDASIRDEDEVGFQAIDVNAFLQTMDSSPSKVKIVVLDACRDNPFANQFRSASRGLASVTAPSGTYIAYSTAPGSVAEDGDGKNSPYTTALAEFILQPGLKIEEAFKQTRIQVMKASSQKQVPWETTSLTGDFYFVPE